MKSFIWLANLEIATIENLKEVISSEYNIMDKDSLLNFTVDKDEIRYMHHLRNDIEF